MQNDKKLDILNYSKDNLTKLLTSFELKSYLATQLFEAIYKKNKTSFNDISNISNKSKEILNTYFCLKKLDIELVQTSNDSTQKYLFKLEDANLIETVLMNQVYGVSVCVTTQVGCNMGCSFCASGITKKVRNLEVFEMVMQVVTINNILSKENKKVSHIVIMGTGEPFDNYDNVIEFIKIINDPKGLEIGARHITVSTCGITPKIEEFSKLNIQVNLAISLHFVSNEKRNKHMPINKKYNLETLKNALINYYSITNRRITFEYILLKDINDKEEDLQLLIKYCKDLNCYVNLIPYNKTSLNFTKSNKINHFFNILTQNKINTIVRKELGSDIDAACGQLKARRGIK